MDITYQFHFHNMLISNKSVLRKCTSKQRLTLVAHTRQQGRLVLHSLTCSTSRRKGQKPASDSGKQNTRTSLRRKPLKKKSIYYTRRFPLPFTPWVMNLKNWSKHYHEKWRQTKLTSQYRNHNAIKLHHIRHFGSSGSTFLYRCCCCELNV